VNIAGGIQSERRSAVKIIALLVHDDDGQEARLQVALDVARAVNGHLTCIDVAVPVPAGVPFGGVTPVLTTAILEREGANRARIETRLEAEIISSDWVEMVGNIATSLVQISAFTDLIIVDREADRFFPAGVSSAASEVVQTGMPILAVPAEARRFGAAGHALIAWDGSPSAIAAMRAAIPLLQQAEAVTLIEIDDGSVTTPAEDAATYLARHGILATVRPKHPLIDTAGKTLLAHVEHLRASYLVMGGFGHSRMHERLFGGVTRTMLASSPIPLFLVHAPLA
jgi:nucleotide-binding universal stress UspA family protein